MATSIKRTELPDAVYIKKHKGKGRKIVVHFIKKLKGKPVFKDKPETIIKKVLVLYCND